MRRSTLSSVLIALFGSILCLKTAESSPMDWDNFVIVDAEKDIAELDVGDVNDLEADLPFGFDNPKVKRKKKRPPKFDADKPNEWFNLGGLGGKIPNMGFVTFKQELVEKITKEETEKIAVRWRQMLENNHIKAQIYGVDKGRMVVVVNDGDNPLGPVKEFIVQQPEVDWYEFNSRMYFPEGRKEPLMDSDTRQRRDDKQKKIEEEEEERRKKEREQREKEYEEKAKQQALKHAQARARGEIIEEKKPKVETLGDDEL
eukprot:GDKI01006781.1.p2 GENE.GDKI01006781.1~~GDKI01006781.1.p2  ORF type:complete len:258 (-),score=76.92 GDKI01006781.1:40-813(-)